MGLHWHPLTCNSHELPNNRWNQETVGCKVSKSCFRQRWGSRLVDLSRALVWRLLDYSFILWIYPYILGGVQMKGERKPPLHSTPRMRCPHRLNLWAARSETTIPTQRKGSSIGWVPRPRKPMTALPSAWKVRYIGSSAGASRWNFPIHATSREVAAI